MFISSQRQFSQSSYHDDSPAKFSHAPANGPKQLHNSTRGTFGDHLANSKPAESTSESLATASSLLEFLSGGSPAFQYQLKLTSEVPKPAFKERAFPLECIVTDMAGHDASLPQPVEFKIMLFTADLPPKLLKTNTSGGVAIRGTTQSVSQGLVFFRKVVINEVSSHFRGLFLVVCTDQVPYIKPLILDNFVVNARRVTDDGPRKRKKAE